MINLQEATEEKIVYRPRLDMSNKTGYRKQQQYRNEIIGGEQGVLFPTNH